MEFAAGWGKAVVDVEELLRKVRQAAKSMTNQREALWHSIGQRPLVNLNRRLRHLATRVQRRGEKSSSLSTTYQPAIQIPYGSTARKLALETTLPRYTHHPMSRNHHYLAANRSLHA